jgi:hypothetical protein
MSKQTALDILKSDDFIGISKASLKSHIKRRMAVAMNQDCVFSQNA